MYLSRNDEIKLKNLKNELNYRNKQIDIYFNNGRPIFNYIKDKKYLIYNNKFTNKSKISIV